MKIQSSIIPSLTNTFYSQTKFIVSNACQNISILLRFYLKSLGVESQVICGVYHIASHELTAPHVFLKIGGHVIDNTYIHSDTEKSAQENLAAFIEEISPTLRNLENYVEESPSKTRLHLRGGEAERSEWIFMEVGCMNDLNQRKQVASVMHSAITNPGTLIYDKLMRIFIKREFNVEIDSVENEMSKVCWNCGLDRVNLHTCSGCQFAKYCDKKCITDDWKPMHKMMHKIIKMGNNSALSKMIN